MLLLGRILKVVLAVALLAVVSVVYLGGYWENFYLLDRLSGPMRFRQFVCDPIPGTISKVRGGYSGFPQGMVLTRFRFSEEFPRSCLDGKWTEVSAEELATLPLPQLDIEISSLFIHSEAERFLVIDRAGGEAALFIP